jgi:hypothetical protein
MQFVEWREQMPSDCPLLVRSQSASVCGVAENRSQHCPRRHAILADTVDITLQGQLNITAKFEPGIDEAKNSAGINHTLRNLRLIESSCGT